MINHNGTTALVTGGASGIGKALAAALKARGATVVIADVNETTLKAAAGELGPGTHAIACDLADSAAPARLIAEAYAVTGRLDLVCSNAGIGHNKRILKEPLDAATDRLFNVNLFAAVRLAQAYAARLEAENARGRIMFTASENSLSVPSAVKGMRLGLYAATKHALLITLEWLRDEVAGGPLDVHVLLPGAVYTPLVARNLPDPKMAPPALNLIMPDRCAEIALKGMDLGLFYIPTQPHLLADMQPRIAAMAASIKALEL
jgi:NAD(P)-dependent dehydrogenase (short-subunit alcohol dehydrogenase family)